MCGVRARVCVVGRREKRKCVAVCQDCSRVMLLLGNPNPNPNPKGDVVARETKVSKDSTSATIVTNSTTI
jgi:hypothetical protein